MQTQRRIQQKTQAESRLCSVELCFSFSQNFTTRACIAQRCMRGPEGVHVFVNTPNMEYHSLLKLLTCAAYTFALDSQCFAECGLPFFSLIFEELKCIHSAHHGEPSAFSHACAVFCTCTLCFRPGAAANLCLCCMRSALLL